MFWNDLLLFVDFGLDHITINRRCGPTISLWNIAGRMAASPTCAPVAFWIIDEAMALMWFLGRSVLKTAIATIMGSQAFSLIIHIYSIWFTVNRLFLIMIIILVSHVWNTLYILSTSIASIAAVVIWSLSMIWTWVITIRNYSITTFPLWTSSQYWITCRPSHIRRYDLRGISTWISYSCIMTWPSLWGINNLLRCWLIILHGAHIIRGLRISQAIVIVVDLRDTSMYILVIDVWTILSRQSAIWWNDIGRLLTSLIPTCIGNWISMRLYWWPRRRSNRWYTIALRNIFTGSILYCI